METTPRFLPSPATFPEQTAARAPWCSAALCNYACAPATLATLAGWFLGTSLSLHGKSIGSRCMVSKAQQTSPAGTGWETSASVSFLITTVKRKIKYVN